MRIGILGGGLAGLALQRFLRHDSEVLEKQETFGGLCRSYNKDGFLYDIGGHILYSKNAELSHLIRSFLGHNVHNRRRNNKILFGGRYVKYPFENGLGDLEKQDIYDCLIGYINNSYSAPSNFREWISYTFGEGISSKYLIPYNEKIWKFDLSKMDTEWVERVPRPPLEDIIKSAVGIETEGYTHQLFFDYPLLGGIESLIRAIIKKDSQNTAGYEVKIIRRTAGGFTVSNGIDERSYDKIVITFPINEAISCMDNAPQNVQGAARRLRHNSVRVVLIGLNNESLLDKTAVYIPDSSIAAHRICFMGYFSRSNAPYGKSSLIAEVSAFKGHELYEMSDATLIERLVDELDEKGIIDRNDVITTDITNTEYAYIIYDLEYRENLRIVRDFLGSLGIETLGRFGEYEYINMDEVIKRSIMVANKMNSIG